MPRVAFTQGLDNERVWYPLQGEGVAVERCVCQAVSLITVDVLPRPSQLPVGWWEIGQMFGYLVRIEQGEVIHLLPQLPELLLVGNKVGKKCANIVVAADQIDEFRTVELFGIVDELFIGVQFCHHGITLPSASFFLASESG